MSKPSKKNTLKKRPSKSSNKKQPSTKIQALHQEPDKNKTKTKKKKP